MSEGTLGRLAASVREGGGLLAPTALDVEGEGEHGAAAAAGERARGHEAEYALLVEEIREGYLQHYGEGRALRCEDPDLALLAGDRLFALGLARLAELGDLEAHAAWCRALLARGVYPPPSQFEAWFPSLAHTAEQVERTVEAAAAAFAEADAVRRPTGAAG